MKALTDGADHILDPYIGVGTTPIAATLNNLRVLVLDIVAEYVKAAGERIALARRGLPRILPMNRPVYRPSGMEKVVQNPYSGDKEHLRLTP